MLMLPNDMIPMVMKSYFLRVGFKWIRQKGADVRSRSQLIEVWPSEYVQKGKAWPSDQLQRTDVGVAKWMCTEM